MKIFDSIAQAGGEVATVLWGRYPHFVYGAGLSSESQEVPVFVFHDIEPVQFERKLHYLKQNGYTTISSDEYHAWTTSGKTIPSRAVLLAIDDGVESVWQFGYPLLWKYGFTATVFLIPGYIRHRPQYHHNLWDEWQGRCSRKDIYRREPGYYNLMYWEEIREIHDRGVIDFQSHSLYHHQVFTEDKLTGFFSPKPGVCFYDWVIPQGYEVHINDGSINDHLGFPVYESHSIFSTMKRFVDDEDLRCRMEEKAAELGGLEFFGKESNGNSILREHYNRLRKSHVSGRMISAREVEDEIADNLARSKEIIEGQLNKKVNHLCYPYSFFSDRAIELSKRVGYMSNFVGVHPGKRSNLQGQDPFYTVRLKSDYLETLPGQGRTYLFNVILDKFRRRVAGGGMS